MQHGDNIHQGAADPHGKKFLNAKAWEPSGAFSQDSDSPRRTQVVEATVSLNIIKLYIRLVLHEHQTFPHITSAELYNGPEAMKHQRLYMTDEKRLRKVRFR